MSYQEPKYKNSPDTVWKKGETLFGLSDAIRSIQNTKLAYQVEGNIDVIQMFQAGLTNTVAPCGTALTVEQIRLLKRFTTTVCIVPDNDEPGRKALMKNARLYIENGFTVKVLFPDLNKDPDDQLKKLHTPEEIENWVRNTEDFVTGYFLRTCMERGETSPAEARDAITEMGELIEIMPDRILREMYYSAVGKIWSDFRKIYKLKIRKEDNTEAITEKLKQDQARDWFEFQFWEEGGAYWTNAQNGKRVRICTFTMEILYFVWSEDQPKYVCKFTNMFGKTRVTYITTDDFSNLSALKKALGRLGSVFVFEGNEDMLNKLKIKFFYGVKEAEEPQYMGYHPSSDIYVWANGIYYRGEFIKADKYGMVAIKRPITTLDKFKALKPESQIEIAELIQVINTPDEVIEKIGENDLLHLIQSQKVYHMNYYYLPFSSTLNRGENEDNSDMKKKFRHFQKYGKTFSEWARLMVDTYGDNGKVMVCYYIACIYRDVIYKSNNNYFPVLFMFGMPGTGKSRAAESISAMFGEVMEDGINLESGSTSTGIRRFVSSVQNGLIWLNEYKNYLKPEIIGMLKGLADGSGKLTGQKTAGLETKSFNPKSAALVSGQDIPTKDPAFTSRCILLEFTKSGRNYEAFHQLKEVYEREGYTTAITCAMTDYRGFITDYKKTEPSITRELRAACAEKFDYEVSDRLLLNMSSILTPFLLLSKNTAIQFPFSYEEIKRILIEKIEMQIRIQFSTDDIEQYFHVIISLIGKTIFEGTHYMIKKDRQTQKTILYLRFSVIHNFYLEAASRQGITALSFATMKSYLQKHRSFVHFNENAIKFPNLENKTSAFLLDYHILLQQGIEFPSSTNISELKAGYEENDIPPQAATKAESQSIENGNLFNEHNENSNYDDIPF